MRLLHISDLHAGSVEETAVERSLEPLIARVSPELIAVTGDLAHRGRRREHERAAAFLRGLGRPLLVIPGNHDIPYTFPARFTRPWAEFERQWETVEPVFRSEGLVVVGLNSVRPWRHQGGRLSSARLARAAETLRDAAAGSLRVVALHHHLAGAPWRASRKFPLQHRDRALASLAAAGAELVLGGHIHQTVVTTRPEFEALDASADTVVLATAPGLGRPRPHRAGEAQGAMVYEWDDRSLTALTYVLEGGRFGEIARREFPRRRSE